MSQKVKKIFIVDDDKMFSEMLLDCLTTKTKHEVQVFATGEECLKHLDEKPDIIILDYNLNSIYKGAANGMQILEAIKDENRSIRVIMLSGQEAYGVALQTVNKGAEEYLIKDEETFEKIVPLCNG